MKKVLVIDGFSTYNEKEILLARLRYLNPIVDYFAISEMDHTFSGRPRDSLWLKVKDLPEFVPFKDKVLHIFSKGPRSGYSWDNDFFQRDQLSTLFNDPLVLNKDRLCLVGDLDEIPSLEAIQYSLDKFPGIPLKFQQELFYYNFHTRFGNAQGPEPFYHTSSYPALAGQLVPAAHRGIRAPHDNFAINPVKQGGWHLSYFGDIKFIQNKLISASHTEFSGPAYTNEARIRDRVEKNVDIFDLWAHRMQHVEDYSYIPEIIRKTVEPITYKDPKDNK